MTLAEPLTVIDKWAHCRCVYARAPSDPCRCVPVGYAFPWRWTCDDPVKETEELTARDKAERRRRKK